MEITQLVTLINRSKVIGFIIILFANCHSKKDSYKYYVYANDELSCEFVFLLERDSLKYTESRDTFSDNKEQKDIVYRILNNSEKSSQIYVVYNQRFEIDCSKENDLDYIKSMLAESLKDLHAGCISSELEEIVFSDQKFLFTHCGNNAILVTCLNSYIVSVYLYRQKINSEEEVRRLFRFKKM